MKSDPTYLVGSHIVGCNVSRCQSHKQNSRIVICSDVTAKERMFQKLLPSKIQAAVVTALSEEIVSCYTIPRDCNEGRVSAILIPDNGADCVEWLLVFFGSELCVSFGGECTAVAVKTAHYY